MVPLSNVTVQSNVTDVSARLVVRLPSVTADVANGAASVPLGLPALSVSILKFKFAAGLHVLQRFSLNVFHGTQAQITIILILVLFMLSHIFRLVVACAVVGIVSIKTGCHAMIASHARNVLS